MSSKPPPNRAGSGRDTSGRFLPGKSGNPAGRRPAPRRAGSSDRVVVADGWQNILTRLGTSEDKRSATRYRVTRLTEREARDLWRTDDIAARVVEELPKDAFRPGLTTTIEGDSDRKQSTAVQNTLRNLNADAAFVHAGSLERAVGGAAIYPVLIDGESDLAQPLILGAITEVSRLLVLEPRELEPASYYEDINEPRFGFPSSYYLRPLAPRGNARGVDYNTVIHATRLIVFDGLRFSRDDRGMTQGWGYSVLQRVVDALANYSSGLDSGAALLQDFSQGVLKIKDLAEMVANDDEEEVVKRFRTIMMAKGVLRNLVIDADDDYSRTETPMSGLPEMVDRLERRVAAAANMPLTKLMGMSPGGLNATGQSDVQNWNRNVANERAENYQDRYRALTELVLSSKTGPTKGKIPTAWSQEFNPLEETDHSADADVRLKNAQTDQIYFDMGFPGSAIIKGRFGGDEYGHELRLSEEDLAPAEVPIPGEGGDLREPTAGAPGAAPAAGGADNIQTQVLNGAQLQAMIDVVSRVAAGEIPRPAGVQCLALALQIPVARAELLMGPEDFVPRAEPAAPAPLPFPVAGGAP